MNSMDTSAAMCRLEPQPGPHLLWPEWCYCTPDLHGNQRLQRGYRSTDLAELQAMGQPDDASNR